jgi:hypothetical protein
VNVPHSQKDCLLRLKLHLQPQPGLAPPSPPSAACSFACSDPAICCLVPLLYEPAARVRLVRLRLLSRPSRNLRYLKLPSPGPVPLCDSDISQTSTCIYTSGRYGLLVLHIGSSALPVLRTTAGRQPEQSQPAEHRSIGSIPFTTDFREFNHLDCVEVSLTVPTGAI